VATEAACCAGAADSASLFEAPVAVEVAWAVRYGRCGIGGACARGGDSFEAGEAGDAVGSLGFQGCGGGSRGGRRLVRVAGVREWLALVAVFDGGGRQCGQGGGAGVGRASKPSPIRFPKSANRFSSQIETKERMEILRSHFRRSDGVRGRRWEIDQCGSSHRGE
jgi:hypothetical protein